MSQIKFEFKKMLFQFKRQHKGGHGIHSPYLYHLLTCIIEPEDQYYAFYEIERRKNKIIKEINNLISEKKVDKIEKKNLKFISKFFKLENEKNRFCFRIVNTFLPKCILVVGDCEHLSSAYLAKINSKSKVYCISNNSESKLLQVGFRLNDKLQIIDVENVGKIKESFGFVLISANIPESFFNQYWNTIVENLDSETIIIIEGIHKQKWKLEIWKQLIKDDRFSLCVNFLSCGLLVKREGMQKENFTIKYRW